MNLHIAYSIITILVIAVVVLVGLGWRKKLQFRKITSKERYLLEELLTNLDETRNNSQFDYPEADELEKFLVHNLGTNYYKRDCWWDVVYNTGTILKLVQKKHRDFLISCLKNPTSSFVRELDQWELRGVFDKIFLLNAKVPNTQEMSNKRITQEIGKYETVLAQVLNYQNRVSLESIRKNIGEVKSLVSDGKLDADSIPTTDPVLQQIFKEETAPKV
jgi:hypothetical protein